VVRKIAQHGAEMTVRAVLDVGAILSVVVTIPAS
jgi:hypothetical protein